ncbi:MAG: TRAP transporter small permease subunit [Deltaproteobacteria bacterium]|jgi:TRAP-type mannitol/chloroaromatic compound transport system permease small subunit|nr:TRAP transporter small permease subunit [Deltaproteobacteria bacterium]
MPKFVVSYVRRIDALNRFVGRFVLYFIFVIMGVLLFSTVSRWLFDKPVIWGVEMAQFGMVIYYTLGGGFALLLNSHVRMDLLYAGWGRRKQARMDVFTFICVLGYLSLLLYGCLSSTAYSLEYDQRNNTAWGPPIAPVKIVLAVGIALTLLQVFSEFFKDLARSRGLELGVDIPEKALLATNSAEKSALETPRPAPALSPPLEAVPSGA